MGFLDSLTSIMVSGIEGLKKRSVLMVHFLTSLSIAGLIAFSITNCIPGFGVEPSSSLLTLLLLILVFCSYLYTWEWREIQEIIEKNVPNMLDDVLAKDFNYFIDSITSKTIYDFIKVGGVGKAVRLLRIPITYYAMWILGICSADLLAYVLSGYRYTVLGYLARHWELVPAPVLVALILSMFIEFREFSEGEEAFNTINKGYINIGFVENTIKKFFSFKGLAPHLRFLEALLTLPPPALGGWRPINIDVFSVLYKKTGGGQNKVKNLPGDIIENMINENCRNVNESYCLKPYKKDCRGPLKTNANSPYKACWYKVFKKKNNMWNPIGYALIIIYTQKDVEAEVMREKLEECINELKKGIKRAQCKVVIDLLRKYMAKEAIATIILIGTEELLGLRLRLQSIY